MSHTKKNFDADTEPSTYEAQEDLVGETYTIDPVIAGAVHEDGEYHRSFSSRQIHVGAPLFPKKVATSDE